MAQTRRKRRSKHRGNAAGTIEARGRTGRPPTAGEKKQAARASARERRLNTPPTWPASFKRAALAAGFMLVILIFIQKGSVGHRIESGVLVAVLALAIYAPAGYYLELFMYRRRMAKQATGVER